MAQGSDEEGPTLPTNRSNEEFRPFMRRLPEFKFWLSTMKSTLIAFFCTFFEFFDIPVFWPILGITLVLPSERHESIYFSDVLHRAHLPDDEAPNHGGLKRGLANPVLTG